jgi:hypothetical protein
LNINQKAIELLEQNEYEESLKLFQEAVKISRDIQSLTNLAWIYCNEEYDDSKALDLLKEAVKMNPASYFPYNLLGEVYLRLEKWENAKEILEKSVATHPNKIAFNNLGIAYYHLGNLEDAANYFLLGSEPSDWSMYSYVKCLIELGNINEAKLKLDTFSENDDEFVGQVDVADLYVELNCHKEAVLWFEKGWDVYAKDPNWISRYIYSLVNLNNPTRAQQILYQTINEKIEEIKDRYEEECDKEWTEIDKKERIKELLDEKKEYEQVFVRISEGYIPKMKYETSIMTECYLFGCKRHNHPEYQKYLTIFLLNSHENRN